MIAKIQYVKACTECGGELDTDGKTCTKCREKRKVRRKEDVEFFRSIGICPYCRKEKLFYNQRECDSCHEKNVRRSMEYRRLNKNKYNEYCKRRRKKCKEEGICTVCGRKANPGNTMCRECLNKLSRSHRKKKAEKTGGISRSEYISYGLCYFCGQPVYADKKVCKSHYEILLQHLPNPKQHDKNHSWIDDNKIIFKKRNKMTIQQRNSV